MISYVQFICEPNNAELTVMQHTALIPKSLPHPKLECVVQTA